MVLGGLGSYFTCFKQRRWANSSPHHQCYHKSSTDSVSSPHRQYFHPEDVDSEVSFIPNQCVEGALVTITVVVCLFVFPQENQNCITNLCVLLHNCPVLSMISSHALFNWLSYGRAWACSSVAVASCLHFIKEMKIFTFSEYFSKFPDVTWMPELLFDALIVISMFLALCDVNI